VNNNFPKVIYVYVQDMDGDEPIYAVETYPQDLPDDEDGSAVAQYVFTGVHRLQITKELV